MNAILLTVLALGGADASANYGGGHGGPGYGGDAGGYCESCDCGGRGHCRLCRLCGDERQKICDYIGPMPQSCYNPSFGCYPSTRFMHRYPAFHGNYYREAYNYRNYFDYPWHAGLHEPTSHFSYHVPGEAPPAASPPQPVPSAASLSRPVRAASAEAPLKSVMTVTPYKVQR